MTIAKTSIAELRNRVVLCTQQDVVEKNGVIELTRKEVVETWARIRPFITFGAKGAFISQAGYHILDPKLHQSHWIVIRAQHHIDITAMAWIYERRLTSAPRWYKVLGVIDLEDGRWTEIAVMLHERSDNAIPPQGVLSPVQSNVRL